MKTVINFIKESIDEMRFKVNWPTYSELQSSAILVVVASAIFAGLVFGMDYIFRIGITSIYKYL